MDPSEKSFTAAVLTQVAGCSPDTLRTWRNRNGLFPDTAKQPGWKRFSLVDMCVVRAVVLMTDHGITANHAVWYANSHLQLDFSLILRDESLGRFVAVIRNPKPSTERTLVVRDDGTFEVVEGADLPPQEILFKRLPDGAAVQAALAEANGIATIIDVEEIVAQVRARFEAGRK